MIFFSVFVTSHKTAFLPLLAPHKNIYILQKKIEIDLPTFRHFDTFSDNSFLNIFSFAICHETTLADKGSPGILIKIFTRFSVAKTLNSFQTLSPLQTYTLHFLQRSYHMMSESIFSSCCFFLLVCDFLTQ